MCVSPLANTVMVASDEFYVSEGALDPPAISHNSTFTKSNTRNTPSSSKIKNSDMSLVREHYKSQGLVEDTVQPLMRSWRGSTNKHYNV